MRSSEGEVTGEGNVAAIANQAAHVYGSKTTAFAVLLVISS